jgi:hypothetical protein
MEAEALAQAINPGAAEADNETFGTCDDDGARTQKSARLLGRLPNRKRRCYQRRSGAPTRGTRPLRLALAGATRSGSAGVGRPGSRSVGNGYAASKWSQLERQLILGQRLYHQSRHRSIGLHRAGGSFIRLNGISLTVQKVDLLVKRLRRIRRCLKL